MNNYTPKMNHEEIKNLNRTITNKEIESVINPLIPPHPESPRPDGFIGEFSRTFKEELIPIILKLFQKTEEEGHTP